MLVTKFLVQYKKINLEPQQKGAFMASFLYTKTKRVHIGSVYEGRAISRQS